MNMTSEVRGEHDHAVEPEQRIDLKVGQAQAQEQRDGRRQASTTPARSQASDPSETRTDARGATGGDARRVRGGAAHSSILRPSSEYVQSSSGQASARKPWSKPGCTVWAMTRS